MNVKNFDELYPGRFFKAGLVTEKPTYTISDVYLDTLEGGEKVQKKGIIKFSDSEFELTLNKTNGQCLKAMFGSELKAWIGKRVTLCSEQTKFGKDTVDAVRVYGSPDLSEDINVTINMPKKKPVVRVIKRILNPNDELAQLLEDELFTDEYRETVINWLKQNPNGVNKAINQVKAKLIELLNAKG